MFSQKEVEKESAPNGFLSRAEILMGYGLILAIVVLAYLSVSLWDSNSLAIAAIILATTLQIFLIVFRKRPVSANFKIGWTSGIDLRWYFKSNERMA